MADDEPTGGINTARTLAVGGSVQGNIEVEGDIDYYAVELQAGVTYQFDLEGVRTGAGSLDDPLFEGLFSSNNVRLVDQDDDGGVRSNSRIVFTPDTDGTYFIAASSFNNTGAISVEQDDVGTYTLYLEEESKSLRPDPVDIATVPASSNVLINSLAAGAGPDVAPFGIVYAPDDDGITRVTYSVPDADSTFLVPFQENETDLNQSFRPVSANAEAAFENVLAAVSSFSNLKLERVADEGTQFGVLRLLGNDAFVGSTLGIGGFPSEVLTGGNIIVFERRLENETHTSWVVLHEVGHTLGLTHMRNSDEAISNRFEVSDRYFGIEFTQMVPSFTSALFPDAESISLYPTTFGYIDMLALRHLYGADDTAVEGDNLYVFDVKQQYHETIFDTGGTDTIEIIGSGESVSINLTPQSENFGGSFIDVGTTLNYFGRSGNLVGSRKDSVFLTPETVIENVKTSDGGDLIIGNGVANRLEGMAGSDSIMGAGGDDNVIGGTGNDFLSGGVGNDALSGGLGDDVVSGGEGDDRIFAGQGDKGHDTLVGGAGNDIIGGNDGNDFLVGGGAYGITEELWVAADSLEPDGNDTIFGAAGNDTILGGGWEDGIIADANNVFDNLEAVISDRGSNTLWAGLGNDLVYGSGGVDMIGGGDGSDTIYSGGGDDTVFAGAGDYADRVDGGSGDDLIYTGAGNDNIEGGSGNDLLHGGPGNDVYSGGDGADTFVFAANSGVDRITDFDVIEDIISLSALIAFKSFDDLKDLIVMQEEGALISLGVGDSVLLVGVTPDDLTETSFSF